MCIVFKPNKKSELEPRPPINRSLHRYISVILPLMAQTSVVNSTGLYGSKLRDFAVVHVELLSAQVNDCKLNFNIFHLYLQ